jgi:hypothetical protein
MGLFPSSYVCGGKTPTQFCPVETANCNNWTNNCGSHLQLRICYIECDYLTSKANRMVRRVLCYINNKICNLHTLTTESLYINTSVNSPHRAQSFMRSCWLLILSRNYRLFKEHEGMLFIYKSHLLVIIWENMNIMKNNMKLKRNIKLDLKRDRVN